MRLGVTNAVPRFLLMGMHGTEYQVLIMRATHRPIVFGGQRIKMKRDFGLSLYYKDT